MQNLLSLKIVTIVHIFVYIVPNRIRNYWISNRFSIYS